MSALKASDIDLLQEQRVLFEHWAHALAILPIRDYLSSLPMMQRIASGDTHWYPKDRKQVTKVLKSIRDEGPLSAKDFKDKKTSDAMWARSPSKIALEQLFMKGELMVPRRRNFHKVYDLRERVLPSGIDIRTPTIEELCCHLIGSYLRAQGLVQIAELTFLRKGLRKKMSQTVANFVEEGILKELEVNGQIYYATPKSLDLSIKVYPALSCVSPRHSTMPSFSANVLLRSSNSTTRSSVMCLRRSASPDTSVCQCCEAIDSLRVSMRRQAGRRACFM